ncbi:hypothetical protein [Suttonella ornithocola]|nr:hypothetical protein [Suttonella ornithocola]
MATNSFFTRSMAENYWRIICSQREEPLRQFFQFNAKIYWRHTGEAFIRVNTNYPGTWQADIERCDVMTNLTITAVRIFNTQKSYHVVSFIHHEKGKIHTLEEYWGEQLPPPNTRPSY